MSGTLDVKGVDKWAVYFVELLTEANLEQERGKASCCDSKVAAVGHCPPNPIYQNFFF